MIASHGFFYNDMDRATQQIFRKSLKNFVMYGKKCKLLIHLF